MTSLTYQLIVEPRVKCNIPDMSQLPTVINEHCGLYDAIVYTWTLYSSVS